MLSTSQKGPPVYILFLAYLLLVLAQWPASYFIHYVSLSLGILLNEGLIVAGLPLWLTHRWKIPFPKTFPFRKPKKKELFWAILMTLSLVFLIDYLTFLSEKIWAPSEEVQTLLEKLLRVEGISEGVWRWFLLCLTPAFCEEIFFRGFFQNTLRTHWSERLSLVTTAFLFALIHGIPQYWHLYFILGLFLSWLLLVSRNLWFPILAHLLNNSWTYLTHLLGYEIPSGKSWVTFDSAVMGICVIVFFISTKRFCQETLVASEI